MVGVVGCVNENQLTGRSGGGGGSRVNRRGDGGGCSGGNRAGNLTGPFGVSESLQDGRSGGLGDGTGSPGASLGSDGDTLDDDGLDDLGARDGLRVQGRVE